MTAMAYLETIAEWLRREREELGLEQADVARAIGVSDSAISSWERGRTAMSVVSHAKLRAFFRQKRAESAGKAAEA